MFFDMVNQANAGAGKQQMDEQKRRKRKKEEKGRWRGGGGGGEAMEIKTEHGTRREYYFLKCQSRHAPVSEQRYKEKQR